MSCETQFEKPLKDCPLYSSILLTLWLRYLQTCIKGSVCISFLSTFLQNPQWNSKIPTKTAAAAAATALLLLLLLLQTKKDKHDRMKAFSTAIHWRKNHVYKQWTNFPSAVRMSVKNAFSGNLEPWTSKFFPSLCTLGIPHGNSQPCKLYKKLNLWGKTAVDKSAWIKACYYNEWVFLC